MTLTVGTDTKPSGKLVVRDGRIQPIADTDSAREYLDFLWQDYARKLVEYEGATDEGVTPEDVLQHMAAHMNGRTWATLSDEPEEPDAKKP